MTIRILHVLDSCGFYGKEKVVESICKRSRHVNSILNLSEIKDFDKMVTKYTIGQGVNPKYNERLLTTHYHLYDIIHAHDFKSSFLALKHRKISPHSKIVRTLHGWTDTGILSKKFLYKLIDKLLLPFHDKVISVCPSKRYDVIYNGISPPNDELELDDDIVEFMSYSPCFVSTGRLSEEKNYKSLIRAISFLPGVRLVIFGEGAQREELQKEISSLHAHDKIFLPRYVATPSSYYRYCVGYIQPSLTEGLPIVVLEAAASKKPLFLTNVGGMKIFFDFNFFDKNTAIEIPTDFVGIVDIFHKMIRKPLLMKLYGENAFEMYEKFFTVEKMVEKYDNLYSNLAAIGKT